MATAIPNLLRAILAIIAILALLLVSSPTVVRAQDSTATHKVVAGETLWSLANRFYGDGHRWHDLARLNGLGDNGEKGLAVGQVIKVPAAKSASAAKDAAKPVTETAAQKAAAEKPAVEKAPAPKPVADKPVTEKAPAPKPVSDKPVTGKAPTPKPATEKPLADKAQVEKSAAKPKAADAPKPTAAGAAKPSTGGALASQTAGKSDVAPKAPAKSTSKTAAKPGDKRAEPKGARTADGKPALVLSDSTKANDPQGRRNAANAESVVPAATHIWSVEIPAQRAARGKDVPTVFQGHTYDREDLVAGTARAAVAETPRARVGEYESAPFPMAASRFESAGHVGRRVGASAAGSSRDMERLLLADESDMQPPGGVAASVGARFVAVTMGPELSPGVRLAIPTGVLQVVRADAGKPPVARVVRQAGLIEQGQRLLLVEGAAAPASTKATAMTGGTSGPVSKVLWVQDGALLPSLQSYLVLAATDKDGVHAGDEFWLVSRQGVGADAREQRVAVVRVVRVTSAGSTAIVIQQDQPTIAAGLSARRVAKAN